MARLTGILESSFSGKVGNLVFVQRQGKTYVRSAPKRTKDSSTPAMLQNQQRFAAVMKFCGQFKTTVIPQIWNSAAEGSSGFRLFQKTNSPAFAPDGSIKDAKLIKLSTGKLSFPEGLEAHRTEAGSNTIAVSWPKDAHLGGIHLQDEMVVISAGGGQYSEPKATGLVRHSLGGSFELPDQPSSVTHIYLFFASQNRRNYSKSVCLEV